MSPREISCLSAQSFDLPPCFIDLSYCRGQRFFYFLFLPDSEKEMRGRGRAGNDRDGQFHRRMSFPRLIVQIIFARFTR